jgi:hypothetical protein
MQVSVWRDYLNKLNQLMRRQNRNILLLADNAPTHLMDVTFQLSNIKVHFLPPNTTSHLQPLDAGIINSFKVILNNNIINHSLYFNIYLSLFYKF